MQLIGQRNHEVQPVSVTVEPLTPTPADVFLSSVGISTEHQAQLEKEIGFTASDLVVLTACAQPDTLPDLIHALDNYTETWEAFFTHPEDQRVYRAYRDCLIHMLYPNCAQETVAACNAFEQSLGDRTVLRSIQSPADGDLSRAVMYEAYVDLFGRDGTGSGNFETLEQGLPYLKTLGITHLWILPPFESPGLDAGFDVRDRYKIADKLGGNQAFIQFVKHAADEGIMIMMDMVLNHLSYQSDAFQAAIHPEHPDHAVYRDWFIFRDGTPDHPPSDLPAWVIFGGMHMPQSGNEYFPDAAGKPKTSNWMWVEPIGKWVYCRFMPQMPDVNFHNPRVLINELAVMDHWMRLTQTPMMLRYDALKHIVKLDRHAIHPSHASDHQSLTNIIESYQCDNLPQTHLILRMLRAYADHRYNKSVQLVSEVWDEPSTVLRFCGPNAEGAHQFGFDLMINLVQTLYQKDARHIYQTIDSDRAFPPSLTTLGLVRHHDAIAATDAMKRDLEEGIASLPQFAIPEPVVRALQAYYPEFQKTSVFEDTGISARLRLLVEAIEQSTDPARVIPAVKQTLALLFFVARTPMIYMGDEVGTTNNYGHLLKQSIGDGVHLPGIDLRHAHRSMPAMERMQSLLKDADTPESQIYSFVTHLTGLRRADAYATHWHGTLHPIDVTYCQSGLPAHDVFAALRKPNNDTDDPILMVANLSRDIVTMRIPGVMIEDIEGALEDILGHNAVFYALLDGQPVITLPPKATYWLTRQ